MSNAPLAVALSVYGREPRLMEIINRTQPPSWDVGTAEDRQRIVRHRLISQVDEDSAQQVVARYIQAYQNVRSEFPLLATRLADLEREMVTCYPFHSAFLKQAFRFFFFHSRALVLRTTHDFPLPQGAVLRFMDTASGTLP